MFGFTCPAHCCVGVVLCLDMDLFFSLNFLLRTFLLLLLYLDSMLRVKIFLLLFCLFVCIYLVYLFDFFFFFESGLVEFLVSMSVSFIILWSIKVRTYEKSMGSNLLRMETQIWNISSSFFFFSFLDWNIGVTVSNI